MGVGVGGSVRGGVGGDGGAGGAREEDAVGAGADVAPGVGASDDASQPVIKIRAIIAAVNVVRIVILVLLLYYNLTLNEANLAHYLRLQAFGIPILHYTQHP